MKPGLIIILTLSSLVLASVSFADRGHDHSGYHHDDYDHDDYHHHHGDHHDHDDKWDDGDTAVAAGLGATLLSMSLDAATRNKTAMIEQAEPEAIAYRSGSPTSEVFQNAKAIIEAQAGQTISDEQAASLIVEYNQNLRANL